MMEYIPDMSLKPKNGEIGSKVSDDSSKMNGSDGESKENTSPTRRRRTSKTLLDPTASMVNAMKELNERRGEVKPEDDPFWEKRGGKGSDLIPKFKDVPVRPPRPIKETLEHLQPLDSSSRLLTTTKAMTCGTYHKPEPKKELKIAALPSTSHLLTPTKASEAAHFTPPPVPVEPSPKQSPRSTSPVRECSRLMELTKARQASSWQKRHRDDPDPREHGWNEFFARQGQRRNSGGNGNHSSPSSPAHSGMNGTVSSPSVPVEGAWKPTARANNPYKDVKSKLHNPTVASVRQMWIAEREGHSEFDEDENGDATAEIRRRNDRSPYAYVGSRLLEPTASVRSSMWVNRSYSPERSVSPSHATPPSVEGKATKSQLFSQRQKYVKYDPLDMAADPLSRRNSPSDSQKPGRITYHAPVAVKSTSRGGSATLDSLQEEIPTYSPPLEVDRVFRASDSFAEQANPMVCENGEANEGMQLELIRKEDELDTAAGASGTDDSVVVAVESVKDERAVEAGAAPGPVAEAEDFQEPDKSALNDADAQTVMDAVLQHVAYGIEEYSHTADEAVE